MAGAVSGLAFGHWLTSDRDLSEGQAYLLGLGVASGELLGLGITFLARPNDFNTRLFFATSAISASAGLAVTWILIRNDIQSTAPLGRISIRVMPQNLLSEKPLPLLTIASNF